ncbi:hypothetical protein ACWKWU_07025 [Chitinophaga lutea]
MKTYVLLLLLGLVAPAALAQQPSKPALAGALDNMRNRDTYLRSLLGMVESRPALRDSVANAAGIAKDGETVYFYLEDKVLANDAANVRFLDSIIRKDGFPGIGTVGVERAQYAWLQLHNASPEKYLPQIKAAAEKKDLPFYCYAYSLDKTLMLQGKEQIYGSQVMRGRLKKTGETLTFIWPVQEPERVNERRKQAGINNTVEDFASSNGFTYRVVRLGEFDPEKE